MWLKKEKEEENQQTGEKLGEHTIILNSQE